MIDKYYLEPREFYDSCIVSESEESVVYSSQLVISKLSSSFGKQDNFRLPEEEYAFEALEYYEFNIEPLTLTYNILFDELYIYE